MRTHPHPHTQSFTWTLERFISSCRIHFFLGEDQAAEFFFCCHNFHDFTWWNKGSDLLVEKAFVLLFVCSQTHTLQNIHIKVCGQVTVIEIDGFLTVQHVKIGECPLKFCLPFWAHFELTRAGVGNLGSGDQMQPLQVSGSGPWGSPKPLISVEAAELHQFHVDKKSLCHQG